MIEDIKNPGEIYGEAAPGKQVQFPGQLYSGVKAASGPLTAALVTARVASEAVVSGAPVFTGTFMAGPEGILSGKLTSPPAVTVQFKRLKPEAALPTRGTQDSAGYDLTTPEEISLKAGERGRIPLGFALAIPSDLHGRIESRSGLASKGLVVLTGVVDADYRGEVMVIMQNFSDKTHTFAAGDRVAQLVLRPTVTRHFEEVTGDLQTTDRGVGGFGSTGR